MTASLGGFTDSFLGLLFGAYEEDLAALTTGRGQKIAGGFELFEGFAEVDDVDAVARIEDELLHLGVPTLGLVTEMVT